MIYTTSEAKELQAFVDLAKREFSRDWIAKDKLVISIKKELREYYHKTSQEVVIKGDFDWKIVKGFFPDCVKSIEDAEKYFFRNFYLEREYSAYDCTAEHFTEWYRIVKQHGQFVYWHKISVDC